MPKVKKRLSFEEREAKTLAAQKRERDAIDERDKLFRENILRMRADQEMKEAAAMNAKITTESLAMHSYYNLFKGK